MQALPLSELRVVELGSGDALAYCGKLFADFGAEVVKVEPPGGDPDRQVAPRVERGGGRESASFAWLNSNKRSVTAKLDDPAGVVRIERLLADADLLLDARHPVEIEASTLSHRRLRETQPGLAITALSWFGEHGPYRDYLATDAVCRSLAGLVKLVGPAEGPPVLPRDGQTAVIAGLTAFIPTLAGLFARADQGARRFAVNAFEATLQIAEFDIALALEAGSTRPRIGLNRFGRGFPVGNYATKDGWLGVTVVTPAQWLGFCAMIGLPELGPDPRYSATNDRFIHADELNSIIRPVLMHRTAMDWFERGLALRLPLALVPDMAQLLAQPVMRERGAFATVEIGTASFEAPVLPQRLTASPGKPNGRAPLCGEHDGVELSPHRRIADRAAGASEALPLSGIRIVDLTMGWAGPSAVRQLGDLGADIVKVESCQYPDWFRGTDPRGPYHPERTYEKTYWFQTMNRNKRGITLDLTTADGRAALTKLLAGADAVIDNYAADVLPRLGLDVAAMQAINPRLVIVTMPAFGLTGRWSAARAYGSTLEQASGLPSVTGRDGDPPTMQHAALGDPVGGLNAAAALMLGLTYQQRTGDGQHIDLSQVECMLPMLASSIIEQSVTGHTGPRLGNRHPRFVPSGCFPCAGEDQWVTLVVQSDAQWAALCRVMHRPDLAHDPALATADGRRADEDRIEVAVRHWTSTVRPELAMVTLQEAAIAAGVARLPVDLVGDAHLLATGHWQPVVRPFMGPHLLPSVSYREGFAERPYPIERLAPTLGQHNHEVLREIGLTEAEIGDLHDRGVIGRVATAKKSGGARQAAE
ncbi:L-carnitine dehydratase/bile acid-inducible protein F [Rhodopseudomonas palustris HaA2]|uniref:L-carnitine dehydratase/bile acid-inducible protein F n=1 Tax=Rhodopseudomonas palustris (strain HaA2) TaxID=316058 RepID=Q2IZS5_RHOP2|nr:CoA transferase [Rhodopseudomonas palustris]ABD06285.1 L-carnitine dehydratase/bile acid-inducible protein F [Rhodopseudomonas palustris HaA2]